MARIPYSSLEPLEARIAPASLIMYHPLTDVIPSQGHTSSVIDLANVFDSDAMAGYRTHVVFTTNYDTDPNTPGLQAGKIVLELFDEKAPLTVANFINYVQGAHGDGNYLSTYFHRVHLQAAAQGMPGTALSILQGGGYKDTALTTHIATGSLVHNEFDPTDAERTNTVGTVAMAKTSDPNSATSEFFFNLDDNSTTLNGSNSGGFTVFAKVVQGMDVVNAIANLPFAAVGVEQTSGLPPRDPDPNSTHEIIGPPLEGTPYQIGYLPQPVTSGPNEGLATTIPTPAQLVDITGAQVVPPKHSVVAGITYTGLSITDDATGAVATDVVGRLSGANLSLNYAGASSGSYQVSVTAHAGTDMVQENFHLLLRPNLVGTYTGDSLLTDLQAGDSATESVKLTNTGGGIVKGPVTVSYYLSPSGTTHTGGAIAAGDVPLGSFTTAPLSLASGASLTVTNHLSIPSAAGLAGGAYQILANISAAGPIQTVNGVTSAHPAAADFYTDDDLVPGRSHLFIPGSPPASNLQGHGVADGLLQVIVPGDTSIAKLGVADASQTGAHGKVDIHFYLSLDPNPSRDNTDPLDPTTDLLIGGATGLQIDLASGAATTLSAAIKIPDSLTLTQAGSFYHIFGVVTPSATGGAARDSFSGDNASLGGYHLMAHSFGQIAAVALFEGSNALFTRANAQLTYADASQNLVTLKLAGPGGGSADPDADAGVLWQVENTTTATTFSATLTTAAGLALPTTTHTTVKDIVLSEPVGTLALGQVDWTDAVKALGGVSRLSLGDTSGSGDHFVGIGTSAAGARLRPVVTLGSLQDTSLDSSLPLATLTAVNWLSVNGDLQTVQAPSIDTLKVTHDLTASLSLGSGTPSTATLLKTLSVGGALDGSQVTIAGSVGSVTLGSITNSNFLAGVSFVPQALHDFDSRAAISSFVVTGKLAASHIAAVSIGHISIGSLTTDPNPGAPRIGIIAETIASYHRDTVTLQNLDSTHPAQPGGVADPDENYQVTLLAPSS